jgi:hypothetical protein
MLFDPLQDELLAPPTEALEHVPVNINFNYLLAGGSVVNTRERSGSEEPVRSTACAICFAAQPGLQLDAACGPLLGKAIRDVTRTFEVDGGARSVGPNCDRANSGVPELNS